MRDLAFEVKEFAKSRGAHLVGIASAARFSEAPEGHRPADLLPRAKSIVVFGMRFFQSVLEGHTFCANSELIPEQDLPRIREYVGYLWLYTALNRYLEFIGVQLAYFLSEQGFKTLPLPASGQAGGRFPDGRNWRYGSFSHRHAAVLAGLGTLGLNNLLLTPRYGPRVRLNSVITTAEMQPDPMVMKNVCLGQECGLCLRAETCFGDLYEFDIGGLKMKLAEYRGCQNDLCNRGGDHAGDLPYTRYCIGVCPVGKTTG